MSGNGPANENGAVRVVIADDQALVREGLRAILEAQPDVEVVGEAEDGAQAVALCRELRPDVVLMDIRMPRTDGVEATRRIVATPQLRTRVLVLTTFDLDEYVWDALRAGASGYLLKDARRRDLIEGLRTVAAGNPLLAPVVLRRLAEEFAARPRPGEVPAVVRALTERELEVLRLLARGMSNAQIAEVFSLSEATVKTHVNRVLGKLGLDNRVQAVVLAYESGLVTPGGR